MLVLYVCAELRITAGLGDDESARVRQIIRGAPLLLRSHALSQFLYPIAQCVADGLLWFTLAIWECLMYIVKLRHSVPSGIRLIKIARIFAFKAKLGLANSWRAFEVQRAVVTRGLVGSSRFLEHVLVIACFFDEWSFYWAVFACPRLLLLVCVHLLCIYVYINSIWIFIW